MKLYYYGNPSCQEKTNCCLVVAIIDIHVETYTSKKCAKSEITCSSSSLNPQLTMFILHKMFKKYNVDV